MCRKLQEQALVVYRPYRGVSLTPKGERCANRILRRHRLWEVFLVERLGLAQDIVHEAACRLEHATPDIVADRLDVFLGHPRVSPLGQPIPASDYTMPTFLIQPLTTLSIGQKAHIARCNVDNSAREFLLEHGVHPGAQITVMAVSQNDLLLRVDEECISIERSLAEAIDVEISSGRATRRKAPPISKSAGEQQAVEVIQMPLSELRVGQRGIIVHVGGQGPIRRRMVDMGLVAGTDVKVVRKAPLGDPIEFKVKGYSLSLRKNEARNVIVEVLVEEK